MKKRIEEFRSLPLKELEEQKNDLIQEMEGIVNKAKEEKRTLDNAEKNEFNSIKEKVKNIENEIEEIEEKRAIKRNNNSNSRMLPNIIMPGEKLETRCHSNKNMDFAKLVRGMAGKGWENAPKEREHFRSMQSAENSVVIPTELAAAIIDVSRAESALFGNIPIVQMESNNLTIAVQKKDAVCNFVDEGELIPSSKPIFEPVDLKGKTMAIFIPVSEQLLDSAENLGSQLLNSCAKAISLALDKALIYGKGKIDNSPEEIKGVTLYEDINKVNLVGAEPSYDMAVLGIKAIKNNNIEPDCIAYNTNLATELAILKDANGQYINEPKILSNYDKKESNNINDNECIVYNKNSLLLGIHKNITIEWGTSADLFQRITKGLRVYLRADLGVVNPKGIAQVKNSQE